jgi:lipopolysaccharide export LptBFGC system permease protein LptF
MGFGRNLTIGAVLLLLIYSLFTEFIAEYMIKEKDNIYDYITQDESSLVKSSHKDIYYKIPNDWFFIEVSKRTPGITQQLLDATKNVEWLHENYDIIEKINSPKKKMYLYAGDYPYLQVNEYTIDKQCKAVEYNLKQSSDNSKLISCFLNEIVPKGREQYSSVIDSPFDFNGMERFVHRFYIDDVYFTFMYDCPKDDCDEISQVSDKLLKSMYKK